MDKRKQGDIGLSAAIFYYTREGYSVFCPFTEATRVDLVVIKDNVVTRVQVKTSTQRTKWGYYGVNLTTVSHNRTESAKYKKISAVEVDEVFIWCGNGSLWRVPVGVVDGKGRFSAGYKNREYCVEGQVPVKGDYSARNKESSDKSEPISTSHRSKGKTCPECGDPISDRASTCRRHTPKPRTKINWPPVEEIVSELRKYPYTVVAGELGVSDNAVRKMLTSNGYDYKTLERVA